MAGRVPGCRDDPSGAVAEHVLLALELLDWMARAERLRGRCEGPVVLGLLDQHRRLRKQVHVADVVAMRVRDRDELDLVRLDADGRELTDESLVTPPRD